MSNCVMVLSVYVILLLMNLMQIEKEDIIISDKVKQSANYITSNSKYVKINMEKLREYTLNSIKSNLNNFPTWSECHFDVNQYTLEHIIAYICVIDSLNFCFWPTTQDGYEFEYGDMVNCLNTLLKTNLDFFNALSLSNLKPNNLQENLYNLCPQIKNSNKQFPLLEERCRSLNEFGKFIVNKHKGSFTDFVKNNSNNLNKIMVDIIQNVSTFRDETIYKGKQIFMYKRIQILGADLYSSLNDYTLENFKVTGIEHLTMFPDYRVPQILCELNIMQYETTLKQRIENYVQIAPNSEEEIEIRASTIEVVEVMKKLLKDESKIDVYSIHLDYFLWNEGEKMRKDMIPHHRTLTIFY